ncbi:hypothetical protein BH23PAT1_BH23PAT1_2010 [soil metagenome]
MEATKLLHTPATRSEMLAFTEFYPITLSKRPADLTDKVRRRA